MNGNEDQIRSGSGAAEDVTAEKRGNGYILKSAGGAEAGEITYHPADATTWVLDHTYVDPQYRGGNLAKRLLNLVVDEARENGIRIIPACSYALAQFRRNAEYADVWKQD